MKTLKTESFLIPHNILFNAKTDIILTSDLSRNFIGLDIESQNNIIKLLEKELDTPSNEENHFIISDDFADRQLSINISSIRPRYTPELNVETDNMDAFEAITISENFQKENYKYMGELLIALAKRVKVH